jgi:hypothetical protein
MIPTSSPWENQFTKGHDPNHDVIWYSQALLNMLRDPLTFPFHSGWTKVILSLCLRLGDLFGPTSIWLNQVQCQSQSSWLWWNSGNINMKPGTICKLKALSLKLFYFSPLSQMVQLGLFIFNIMTSLFFVFLVAEAWRDISQIMMIPPPPLSGCVRRTQMYPLFGLAQNL